MVSPDAFRQQVQEAGNWLCGRLRHTPLEPSPALTDLLGVPVHLKLECLQLTGSFKIRGALLRLRALTPDEAARGVVTCSAGNHGLALAHAGSGLGVPVTVFLPADADPSKLETIRRLGAALMIPGPRGFDEVEPLAVAWAMAAGLPYISPFDDEWVMTGNGGTLAAEILEDLPEAASFILPVGGGGLAAGLSRYLSALDRPFQLVACQHQDSPALRLSLERGSAVTRLPAVDTWAGGIEGGIGSRTFDFLRSSVARVALVGEREIRASVAWMLATHHYLVEPSAAAPVAACLHGRVGELAGPAVVILTGRNFAATRLAALLAEFTA